jgi:hypothetical protein
MGNLLRYHLLALPTKDKDIVFRFIIEYSSFMDFGPNFNNRSIFVQGFLKNAYFDLCLNLRLVTEL